MYNDIYYRLTEILINYLDIPENTESDDKIFLFYIFIEYNQYIKYIIIGCIRKSPKTTKKHARIHSKA